MIDAEEFLHGYLDALLFTEDAFPDDEADDTSLLSHGCDRDNFTPEAVALSREDCDAFIKANSADLGAYSELRGDWTGEPDSFGRSSYSASEAAGTDFWFSRNGHGAGYFDRGDESAFRRLQEAAHVYGSVSAYFDGERIHLN